MSPHVAARLHGHGKILLPFPGYRVERADGELVLRVARAGASGIVDVRAPGGAGSLCDVSAGTREGSWRIETTELACAWPEGFALAPDPTAMSPFLLLGPAESMIWIHGPLEAERVVPIDRLASPGQRVRAIADAGRASRIDLDYQHDGAPFWQRRYAIGWGRGRAVVLSAQAPAHAEPAVSLALDLVERTLEPT